jgi:predicted hotdog family 3-hydroxylacyl-ACP dehydratase
MKTLRPVTDLVPHRDGMLLIDELIDDSFEVVKAGVTVRADHLFMQPQGLPAWVGVELMAQTVAAWAGLRRLERGEQIQLGFLLGTRKYECDVPFFPVGARLVMSVRQELVSEQGLAVFVCSIELLPAGGSAWNEPGRVIARASVNAFQPPNVQDFFEGLRNE